MFSRRPSLCLLLRWSPLATSPHLLSCMRSLTAIPVAWASGECRGARRGTADASGQVGTPSRTAASCHTTGHSPVNVPQAQSGLLSPSSHASAGNRMEDRHGEDTREADHVIARGDDSWPAHQGVEGQTAGVPGQRGSPQHGPWLDSLGHWNHMHWCHVPQDLVLTEKTESQSTEEVIAKKISELETLVTGDSIKNFRSIRQLRESYQTEWVQFLLEIQIRGPGDRLRSISTELIGSAALHLLISRKAPAGSPPILGSSAEHPSPALVRSAPQHTLLGLPLSSISFLNPSSTTCYMNSSIHAVLHILALLQPQDQAALGQLCQLWGVIQRNPQGFNPSQNLQWVMLMSPWTRLFEFMSHMLLRLRLLSVTGRWEARKVEAGRELLRDEGLLHHPIALDIQGHTDLAGCIQALAYPIHHPCLGAVLAC